MKCREDDNGLIYIILSKHEAVDILIDRVRYGIEHVPSKTIPVTLDVKTSMWEKILKWAGEEDINTGPEFSDDTKSVLNDQHKFTGIDFIIVKD